MNSFSTELSLCSHAFVPCCSALLVLQQLHILSLALKTGVGLSTTQGCSWVWAESWDCLAQLLLDYRRLSFLIFSSCFRGGGQCHSDGFSLLMLLWNFKIVLLIKGIYNRLTLIICLILDIDMASWSLTLPWGVKSNKSWTTIFVIRDWFNVYGIR